MKMNRQETKWMNAAIRQLVAEGSSAEVMRRMVGIDAEFRQNAIDVGRLLTKMYDDEWLESQRGWLENYRING